MMKTIHGRMIDVLLLFVIHRGGDPYFIMTSSSLTTYYKCCRDKVPPIACLSSDYTDVHMISELYTTSINSNS